MYLHGRFLTYVLVGLGPSHILPTENNAMTKIIGHVCLWQTDFIFVGRVPGSGIATSDFMDSAYFFSVTAISCAF